MFWPKLKGPQDMTSFGIVGVFKKPYDKAKLAGGIEKIGEARLKIHEVNQTLSGEPTSLRPARLAAEQTQAPLQQLPAALHRCVQCDQELVEPQRVRAHAGLAEVLHVARGHVRRDEVHIVAAGRAAVVDHFHIAHVDEGSAPADLHEVAGENGFQAEGRSLVIRGVCGACNSARAARRRLVM